MQLSKSAGNNPIVTLVVAVLLALWFALVFLLSAAGAFVAPPGALPLPVALGVTVPLLAFLLAFATC